MKNSRRFDLSQRLVHFVRSVDLRSDGATTLPEEWSFGNLVEDWVLSPFFLLRHILRSQEVLPTWSIRNGRRTVYGPRPAVCFSEMPLAAFLIAGEDRSARGEHMSTFGVMFKKEDLFALGARPVIYGLTDEQRARKRTDGARVFPESALPLREQYRYVAYNPTRDRPLDWTHEREWRLPSERSMPAATSYDELSGFGLRFEQLQHEVGFIVRTENHARRLLHDILWLVDTHQLPKELFSFIVIADRFPDPHELVTPESVETAIEHSKISLEPYFTLEESRARQIRTRFDRLVEQVLPELSGGQPPMGELGGGWLWLYDNTSELVRALMMEDGRISISASERYLVNLMEYPDFYSLGRREQMTQQLAELVEKEFGESATYFSVLMSNDPNSVPFYTGTSMLSSAYLNYAHNEEDF
ncbi:DUF4427 domain-containing protein [Persicimonas caeni]|uniref:DUF4427 domain-containing protein n=1 Tax=Persicimonas caeni TaxID=2292766 RepID=A0A4Y6PMH9_PERCE|nr:DUF4427 domain-containing protein [Persicimonas caeni]QDG49516.1 DUF4427 domain-containing protein [Persicimonas caeni]QED30737.1 DUF4427 domain-containing protein [Persicimonas caeni]